MNTLHIKRKNLHGVDIEVYFHKLRMRLEELIKEEKWDIDYVKCLHDEEFWMPFCLPAVKKGIFDHNFNHLKTNHFKPVLEEKEISGLFHCELADNGKWNVQPYFGVSGWSECVLPGYWNVQEAIPAKGDFNQLRGHLSQEDKRVKILKEDMTPVRSYLDSDLQLYPSFDVFVYQLIKIVGITYVEASRQYNFHLSNKRYPIDYFYILEAITEKFGTPNCNTKALESDAAIEVTDILEEITTAVCNALVGGIGSDWNWHELLPYELDEVPLYLVFEDLGDYRINDWMEKHPMLNLGLN